MPRWLGAGRIGPEFACSALTKRIEQPDGRDASLIQLQADRVTLPSGMDIDSTRSDRCLTWLIYPFVENVPERHKGRPKPLRIEFVASG